MFGNSKTIHLFYIHNQTKNHQLNKYSIMTVTFLQSYLVPFLITLIVLGLNEYRLFRIGSTTYQSFTNAVAMLVIGMISFITLQVMITKLF